MCFTRDRIEHAVYLVLIKCENVDSPLSNKDKAIDCSCCVLQRSVYMYYLLQLSINKSVASNNLCFVYFLCLLYIN